MHERKRDKLFCKYFIIRTTIRFLQITSSAPHISKGFSYLFDVQFVFLYFYFSTRPRDNQNFGAILIKFLKGLGGTDYDFILLRHFNRQFY